MRFKLCNIDVCLLQRNLEDKSVYDEIIRLGRRCEIVYLDISVQSTAKEAMDKVLQKFSRIDILVNNAGIQKRSP